MDQENKTKEEKLLQNWITGFEIAGTERKKIEDALKESEEKFRLAMSATNDALWDWNIVTNEVYRNPRHATMLGYEPQELSSSQEEWEKRVHPDDKQRVSDAVSEHLKGKTQDIVIEYRLKTKSGDYIWVLGRGKVVAYNDDGKPIRMIGTNTDITERKKAEEMLREEKELSQKYLDTAAVMMLVLDKDGKVSLINQEGCKILGYEKNDIVGKDWFDNFLQKSDRKEVKNIFASIMKDKIDLFRYVEGVVVTATGEERLIGWHNTLLRDSEGRIAATLSSGEDITERKKAEEALQRTKQQMEFILGATKTGLDIIDSDFNMVYIDSEWQKVYGEYKGKKCYEYFMGSNTVCPNCGIVKALKTKKPVISEEALLKEGNRPIQVTTIPFQDEKGNWLVAEVNVDITERKKAEVALREAEQKMRALFDQTFQFIGLMEIDGTLIEANRSALDLAGIEAPSVLGKPFWETPWWTHSPELQEKLRQAIKSVAQGEFVRFEATHLAKDGALHYVDFSLKPVKDESGKVIFMIPEGRDITERKKTEEEIKVFSDAIAGAFDCFMLANIKGNITYANESAIRAFGYAPEELLKLNITKLAADPGVAKKIMQETVAKGKWSGEVTNIRKNKEKFPSLLSAFIIKDDKGKPKGAMGILRDITVRKRAEDALKKAHSELEEDKRLLAEKNIAFQEVIKEIELEKNELKDEIIINVNELILPILKRIKLKEGGSRKYLDLIEKNLKTLTSSFGRRLIEKTLKLTPKEIEICNMIKSGLTTKEISGLLNTSSQTIDKHRKNIRRKFGLRNKDTNLSSLLQSL